MLIKKDIDYISCFDPNTGEYVRTGIIEDSINNKVATLRASFPEFLTIEIIGKSNTGNYKKDLDSIKSYLEFSQMSFSNFKRIIEEIKGRTFQINLCGASDPDRHENFKEMLELCKENSIVPNFTTTGSYINREKAQVYRKICGTVTVIWSNEDSTKRAVKILTESYVQTNILYKLNPSSIEKAISLINRRSFPKEINELIFRIEEPFDLKIKENLKLLLETITNKNIHYSIAFESCSIRILNKLLPLVESKNFKFCEAGRWSAYITSDMTMAPCSNIFQEKSWTISLNNSTIEEGWSNEKFNEFISLTDHNCFDCLNCPDPKNFDHKDLEKETN